MVYSHPADPNILPTNVRQSIGLCLYKNVAFWFQDALRPVQTLFPSEKAATNTLFVAVFDLKL
jgi:hypothetical protein